MATKLKRLRDDRDAGVIAAGRALTVKVWAETWLGICRTYLEESTVSGYEQYVRLYVVPHLGRRQLDRVTAANVEAMYEAMSRSPRRYAKNGETLSSGTIHTCHRVLKACLAMAVERGYCRRNVARDARPPRLEQPELRPYDRAEVQRVIAAAAGTRSGCRWLVALALGLRQGEALGLRWDDLDLETGTIRVRRSMRRAKWQHGCSQLRPCGKDKGWQCPKRVAGGLKAKSPKSAAGTRTFAMPASVVEALKAHRAAQKQEEWRARDEWSHGPDGGYVFATEFGRPVDRRADWADWGELVRLAEVRYINPHGARHTAATLALLAGTPDRVVMARLGWNQASMLTRYQHVLDEADEAAARRMDDMLSTEAKPKKRKSRKAG